MIAIFGRNDDKELQDFVVEACSLAGISQEQVRFFELDKAGLQARDYAEIIHDSEASIIDVDVLDLISYAVEFGAIGSGLSYLSKRGLTFQNELDAQIILFTRQEHRYGGEHELNPVVAFFGKYYSVVSAAHALTRKSIVELSKWIQSAIDAGKPKVFISYRSSSSDFAHKVAKSLNRRGAYVWFDQWNLLPGDAISEAIDRGLTWATHLIVLVDSGFMDSKWTQMELESFLYRYLAGPHQVPQYIKKVDRPIIPLILHGTSRQKLPLAIQRLRSIDCDKQTFRRSMDELWRALA